MHAPMLHGMVHMHGCALESPAKHPHDTSLQKHATGLDTMNHLLEMFKGLCILSHLMNE